MLRCLVVAALLALASGSASAQTVRLDHYRNPPDPKLKVTYKVYLKGVFDGLMGYALAHGPKDGFFCLPPDRIFTAEDAEDIMLRYAEKKKHPGHLPIGIPLLSGLREAFPCPKE